MSEREVYVCVQGARCKEGAQRWSSSGRSTRSHHYTHTYERTWPFPNLFYCICVTFASSSISNSESNRKGKREKMFNIV